MPKDQVFLELGVAPCFTPLHYQMKHNGGDKQRVILHSFETEAPQKKKRSDWSTVPEIPRKVLTGSISKQTNSRPDKATTTCRWFTAHLTIAFLPGAFHSFTLLSGQMWRIPSGYICKFKLKKFVCAEMFFIVKLSHIWETQNLQTERNWYYDMRDWFRTLRGTLTTIQIRVTSMGSVRVWKIGSLPALGCHRIKRRKLE